MFIIVGTHDQQLWKMFENWFKTEVKPKHKVTLKFWFKTKFEIRLIAKTKV